MSGGWRVAGWGLFLAVVFFLATHDLLASLQWRQALPDEVRELVRAVSEGRMQRQIAFPLLGVAGLMALLLPGPPRHRWSPLLAGLLAAFLAWQLLSVIWSQDALLTGRRLMVLAMMVAGAVGLARRCTAGELFGIIAVCTAAHLVVGVVTELWLGTFTPLESGYRFAGTLHPNQQGINCALLAIACLCATGDRDRLSSALRGSAVAGLASGLVFLFLTRSRTAAMAAVLALLLLYVLRSPPLRRVAAVGGLVTAWALLLLLQANGRLGSAGELLLLGRADSQLRTLTGRTEIWGYALRHAAERPIAGYGYNSFWSPRHTAEVSAAVDWKISEGHSAYLDTLLNLGLVGLILFLLVMGVALAAAIWRYRISAQPALAAMAAVLLFGLLDGTLESAVVLPNLLSFITLAVIAALAMGSGLPAPAAAQRGPVHASRVLVPA